MKKRVMCSDCELRAVRQVFFEVLLSVFEGLREDFMVSLESRLRCFVFRICGKFFFSTVKLNYR